MKNIFLMLFMPAIMLAQVNDRPGSKRVQTLPASCVAGIDQAVLFKSGNADATYTCDDTGHYALQPGSSTSTLTGAVGGPAGANAVNGGAAGIVKAGSGGTSTTPATGPDVTSLIGANPVQKATALAATPTTCVTTGQFSNGVDANGNAVGCATPAAGASTPATTNVYKGTGSANGVAIATPGTDYVVPSGTVANATNATNNASGLPIAAVRVTSLPTSCTVGTSTAVVFATGGIDAVYACDNTGRYALPPGGSTTVLAGSGTYANGPGGTNTILTTAPNTNATQRPQNGKNSDFLSSLDFGVFTDFCAAVAGASSGIAIIPANDTRTTTCVSNPGGVTVMDLRAYRKSQYNFKVDFGAKNDLHVFGPSLSSAGTMTNGSNLLTVAGYCFVTTDVGKLAKFSGGNASGPISFDLYGTVTGISGCNAVLSTTATRSSASGPGEFGTDNTQSLLNAMAAVNSNPSSTLYIPAGQYLVNGGPFYSTSSVLIQGEGSNASVIAQYHPTSDLLFLKPIVTTTQELATGQIIRGIGFAGVGQRTTGNLIVDAGIQVLLDDVSLFGTGGRGLLQAGERLFMHNIHWSLTRQALVVSPFSASNESYLDSFTDIFPGITADPFNGAGTYYYDQNATNGVFPTSGNLAQNIHPSIDLVNIENYRIERGSIKPTINQGCFRVGNSAQVKISNVYCESAQAGGIQPNLLFPGPRITTTITSAITTSQTSFDVADGEWFSPYAGQASDLPALTEGGAGATGLYIVVRPPDYVYGSVTASSIGSGILQGNYEYIFVEGIAHDSTGTGWHVTVWPGGRATQGTTAYAWPAGAVYEEGSGFSSGGFVNLDTMHLNSVFSVVSPYTAVCNVNNAQPCGALDAGAMPDAFFYPGTPMYNSATYILSVTGPTGILTNSSISAYEGDGASTLDLRGSTGENGTNFIQASGDSVNIASTGNGNTATRSIYTAGQATLNYQDTRGSFTQNGLATSIPSGFYQLPTWNDAALLNILQNSPILTYGSKYYGIGDPVNTSSYPNHLFLFAADSTNTPGLLYKNWTGSSYVTAMDIQGNTGAAGYLHDATFFFSTSNNIKLTSSTITFSGAGVFSATGNMAINPSGSLQIDQSGTINWIFNGTNFSPNVDATESIGSASKRLSGLFAVLGTFNSIATATNCSSAASPAVCVAAAAGQVQIAAAATSLQINTTAVTANSRVGCLTYSTVGITAPTNVASLIQPYLSAISAGVSFTLTIPVAPLTNPINLQYCLIN